MADHLVLLVTAINGAGPVLGSGGNYEVHLAVRNAPGGTELNLSLGFNSTEAAQLLSLMQARPPNPSSR
jgi:hypothetical protein